MASGLLYQDLTEKIIGTFYSVYNELGHGFAESVYEQSMLLALSDAGMLVARQVPINVFFRGHQVGTFRADMLVEDAVLLELKATFALDKAHEAQLLNYLRATDIEVGLLLNFGDRAQFKRLLFNNNRKKLREHPSVSV